MKHLTLNTGADIAVLKLQKVDGHSGLSYVQAAWLCSIMLGHNHSLKW